ncbi:MAG: DUF4340 domain-containing protein [Bacteroidetes bacterium]|nr:DUF4340 domain-containing protein [Bacteroidota bacterium]MBS1739446.1 DUF4340 domain-containing protein [Bacteroidota bacterium]
MKTAIYLVLLGVLGFGVYYFVFSDQDAFNKNEAAFTIKDTSNVGKIFLSNNEGENITLQRTDSGWYLNEKYKARVSTVNNLLSTMKQQQPLYPVPENAHNSVVKALAGSGVKVEIYNRKGNKTNTFYVGGGAYDFSGTYMLQEGAKHPYVVQIPNFRGFLTPVYSVLFDDWRDRSVMNLQPNEVKSFSIHYVDAPKHSFTIQNGTKLEVQTDSIPATGVLNERRVHSYLKFFADVYAEGYLNGIQGIDSTIASVPKFCTMDITAKNGWNQHIEIFKMPLNKRSKNLSTAKEGEYDIDRFYGIINHNKDTVLLQAFTFDKFFRSGSEFFQDDASTNLMGLPPQKQKP